MPTDGRRTSFPSPFFHKTRKPHEVCPMTEFANKRPTLWMNWSVVGDDGCAKRALAFTTTKTKSSLPHESDQRPANSIAVGDRIRLELRSDMSGYLTIFDFMTSEVFAKFFRG